MDWNGIETRWFKTNVPEPLREWAESVVGTAIDEKVVSGWGWDGKSPGVVLLLAPKGRLYMDAPHDVWVRAQ